MLRTLLTSLLLFSGSVAAQVPTTQKPGFKPIAKQVEPFYLPTVDFERQPGAKPVLKVSVRPLRFRSLSNHPVPPRDFLLTFVGDTGFSRSPYPSTAKGIRRGKGILSYDATLKQVKPLLDGDLNFANIETVVSAKRLRPTNKRFVFQSHPESLRALHRAGFDLAALANNHSYDYGWQGMVETLREAQEITGLRTAGLGTLDDAAQPTLFDLDGTTVAFNAMSFLSHPFHARANRPGQLNLRNPKDVAAVIEGFQQSDAELRILSLHIGRELAAAPEPQNRTLMWRFIEEAEIDIIVAHHPHIVRPVEQHPSGAVIFHSLGNFLLVGASNINGRGTSVDWGALAKVRLRRDSSGHLSLQSAEIHPLKDVHFSPRPLSRAQNQARIQALNRLTARTLPKTGVRWLLSSNGTGIACFELPIDPCRDLAGIERAN